MHVVYFYNTEQFNVTSCWFLIVCTFVAELEKTVKIAAVHYSEGCIWFPLETRGDDFDRILSLLVVPNCVDQVFWELVIDMLGSRLLDEELVFTVVVIELVLEVGGEKEVDTCFLGKSCWEPADSIVYFPIDLLAILFVFYIPKHLPFFKLNRLAHIVDLCAFVDSSYEVVGDFHHWLGVPAQVESLLRCWIDIPVEVFQVLVFLILQKLMEEMESKLAYATEFFFIIFLSVFMCF